MGKGKILMRGSKGPEVFMLQQELNRSVTPRIGVDGDFEGETERAVIQFQKAAGFKGADVDGRVGPKTMTALFQVFDMQIWGMLKPSTNFAEPAPMKLKMPTPTMPTAPAPGPQKLAVPGNPVKANDPAELPKRFQSTLQSGYQYSARDGQGIQTTLGFTFRSRDYYPKSGVNTIYHGMHGEYMFSPVLGAPLPPSSIYTGQLAFTVQPVTDWLVLWDRLHLLTPSILVYGQIPLNHPTQAPGMDDPSGHGRLGGALGLELFHVDIIKDRLTIGVSGQMSGYWDFKDHSMFWDPSVLGFLQWQIGTWSQYKDLTH